MHPILLIPGYLNVGEGHWLTLWANAIPGARPVQMPNWAFPKRPAWVEALDDAIAGCEADSPILVAHGLGCQAVAHWASERDRTVRGALLVAPWDTEREDLPAAIQGFAPVPRMRLPFASRVVASADDPRVELARARAFADSWGSAFTELGKAGGIDTRSGYGPWARGEALLSEMR